MSNDWDFYSLRVDGEPASIFVDLGISKDAPIRSQATMGYLRVLMLRPREDGLSSRDEFDDLIALEDHVTAKVIENGAAVFVGRNTSSGNRDFYFYVADSANFEKVGQNRDARVSCLRVRNGHARGSGVANVFRFFVSIRN